MNTKQPKLLGIALPLRLILILASACVVEREVVVVVTATDEPTAAATETIMTEATEPPPPTTTPAPTQAPDPVETGPTALPNVFPTPVSAQIRVAEQVFENGRMFWIEPTGEIWVMLREDDAQNGAWLIFDDTWQEGEPEEDPALSPPGPGLRQPIRGFGKVWREDPTLQENLGWATDIEYGYSTDYRYDHGGYVTDEGAYQSGPGTHTLVTLGQEVVQFSERTDTWSFVQ